MMVINPNGERLDSALMEKLQGIEPATVGHFLPSACMKSEFQASLGRARIAGQAVTVRIPSIDSTLCHKVVEIAQPGDIIVIDRCGDTTHACWGSHDTGGIFKRNCWRGYRWFGYRHPDIRDMGFPIFFRGSLLTTRILGWKAR